MDQICPRNFLQMADSYIIVSLHLVIPFISMIDTQHKDTLQNDTQLNAIQQNNIWHGDIEHSFTCHNNS
jgi:hypothetical protein